MSFVSEEVVKAIPEPNWTDTWHPVSHARVIESLDQSLKESGINTLSKTYEIKAEGQRVFAVWLLDVKFNGTYLAVGFRNSIDKTFMLGITAGLHVIVCSNLAIEGEYLKFRKHTGGLDYNELRIITDNAVQYLIEHGRAYYSWFERLKEREVKEKDIKAITFDLLLAGIIRKGQVENFLDAVDKEIFHSGANLYSVFNGYTRLVRGTSFFALAYRTRTIKKIISQYEIPEIFNHSNRVLYASRLN